MLAHTPELILSGEYFESACMIEQNLKPGLQGWLPDLHPEIVLGLVSSTSRCLLLPEEPRHAEHSSPDQYAIHPSLSNPTHTVGKTLHVAIPEQERAAASHDVHSPSNGTPVRFAPIHLL
jgi:hypothetical protein